MIHIGEKIREVVHQKRIQVTELARTINKSRTVLYDIFERETIDTGLLMSISKALDHNFFYYYISGSALKEPALSYGKGKSRIELEEELKDCKKEIEYLKKINQLLEEKLKRT